MAKREVLPNSLAGGSSGGTFHGREEITYFVEEDWNPDFGELPYTTYRMVPNPPPMMSWEDYKWRATTEWQALLDSPLGSDELEIHNFLAKHPCFVPGAHGFWPREAMHSPLAWALWSKSPLREWDHAADCYRDVQEIKVPDFLWLAHDCTHYCPVLIRIDSPCIQWFTGNGDPHPDLIEAVNRLAAWREWFKDPKNEVAFCASFGTPRRHMPFQPEFLLICGRRKGPQDAFRRLRAKFLREGQMVMTFDHLVAARECAGYLCVSGNDTGRRVQSVPPTIQLGPNRPSLPTNGLAEAIVRNEWITPERRQFLLERIPYWNRWHVAPKPIPYRIGRDDWE